MQTIEINNPDIERFITTQYGGDTDDLLSDFVKFVKSSMDDGYPSISKEEAKKRIASALNEVKNGNALFVTKEEYDDEMTRFLETL